MAVKKQKVEWSVNSNDHQQRPEISGNGRKRKGYAYFIGEPQNRFVGRYEP